MSAFVKRRSSPVEMQPRFPVNPACPLFDLLLSQQEHKSVTDSAITPSEFCVPEFTSFYPFHRQFSHIGRRFETMTHQPGPSHVGAPSGNRNNLRHGLRAGRLPPGCGTIRRAIDELRRQLEDAVLRAHGEIDVLAAAQIQTAIRFERHAMLAQRWLRLNADMMQPAERLAYSRDIAKASESRDKAMAFTRTWTPPPGGSVNLLELEESVRAIAQRYRCIVNFDPWQSELLKQRLISKIAMREVTFSGANLQKMASAVLEAFNSREVVLYPDEQLIGDLRRLRVIEKSYGFRLEAPRDGTGHGDLGTAFQLAILGAKHLTPPAARADYPTSSLPTDLRNLSHRFSMFRNPFAPRMFRKM